MGALNLDEEEADFLLNSLKWQVEMALEKLNNPNKFPRANITLNQNILRLGNNIISKISNKELSALAQKQSEVAQFEGFDSKLEGLKMQLQALELHQSKDNALLKKCLEAHGL